MAPKLRFSTFGLLLIMTIVACLVGVISWAGRQMGLDGSQIATFLLQILAPQAPVVLVWICGIVLLQRSDVPSNVSLPATIGMGGLLMLLILYPTFNIWWASSTTRSATTHLAMWIVKSLLTIVCWVFLLRSLLAKTHTTGSEENLSELSH